MSSGFAHIFGQIVSIRVKLHSSTNLELSGHIKREKASFLSTCDAHKRLCLNSLIECFHMTSRRPYWCPKTMKRRPCWCPKQILWEFNSFLMQTPSFLPIYLHRCWPREWKHSIERFLLGGQYLCKFIETKESVNIKIEFNSHRIGLEHQRGRRFIVLAAVTSCKNAV